MALSKQPTVLGQVCICWKHVGLKQLSAELVLMGHGRRGAA